MLRLPNKTLNGEEMTLREFLDSIGHQVATFVDNADDFITTVVSEPLLDWPIWYFVWVGVLGIVLFYLGAVILGAMFQVGSRLWDKVPQMPSSVTKLFAKTEYSEWKGWTGAFKSATWAAAIFWSASFIVTSLPLLLGSSGVSPVESLLVAAGLSAAFGGIAFVVLMLSNLMLYLRQ